MLSAMVGRDANDPELVTVSLPPGNDYTRYLRSAGLRGARIGIPRANFYSATVRPDTGASVGGITAQQLAVMEQAIEVLKREGATVIDPADIPSVVDAPANNFLTWGICSGLANRRGMDANCSIVFKYGMKRDFNAYLTSLGPGTFKTLTQVREYNLANRPRNAMRYEQENLDISDEMDLVADRARYEADRAKDIYLSRSHGIDEVMARMQLDALLFPGSSSAAIAAKAGEPTVIVPFGFVPNAPAGLPASFNPKDQPVRCRFHRYPVLRGSLLELAYAFEQEQGGACRHPRRRHNSEPL